MVFEKLSQNEGGGGAVAGGRTCIGESVITPGLIKSGDGRGPIDIRLAEGDQEMSSARDLISRMYAWRGYSFDHKLPAGPVNATFTASCDDEVVGTITLAVDSAAGLAADRTFPTEMQQFREVPGAKLCELTRLAFDANASSKPVLASLFHVIFVYGRKTYGCTDLFIEVNPRHVRFYENMLGFRRVGGLRMNESVDAPSQLMWLKVETIRAMIDAHASGSGETSTRSLYPFFLPKHEERRVYARFAARHAWDERDYEIKSLGDRGASHAPAAPRLPNWIAAAARGARGRARTRALS